MTWEAIAGTARRAEALRFESLWAGDGYGSGRDPVIILAALSRVTEGIRLGAVLAAGERRPPAVTAKALNTLDVLCVGRLSVAVSGADLVAVTETVDIVKGMARGGPFSYSGRRFTVTEAPCQPASVQLPHPPVWIYGDGEGIAELAGRRAEGWMVEASAVAAHRFGPTADWPERVAGHLDEWRAKGVDAVLVPVAGPPDVEIVARACSL